MPSNSAAWITHEKAKPLKVDEAPYTSPAADEILVKNGAVAINPIDWKMQAMAYYAQKYPNIPGCDISGEVVEVGQNVKDFKKGDRVMSHTHQIVTGEPKHGAFQKYTLVSSVLTAHIPSNVSFSDAVVLPLAVSTASVLLVWGGSSSVGSAVIQLACASGLEVVATASKRNFDFCKGLGATHVFDYNDKSVVDDLVKALKGKELAGAYNAVGTEGSTEMCAEVLSRTDGGKFVASVLPPPSNLREGIEAKMIHGLSLLNNEVGPAVWRDYLPKALEQGKLRPAPEPLVVGEGLASVQKAMDKNQEGVSAKKVVVILS